MHRKFANDDVPFTVSSASIAGVLFVHVLQLWLECRQILFLLLAVRHVRRLRRNATLCNCMPMGRCKQRTRAKVCWVCIAAVAAFRCRASNSNKQHGAQWSKYDDDENDACDVCACSSSWLPCIHWSPNYVFVSCRPVRCALSFAGWWIRCGGFTGVHLMRTTYIFVELKMQRWERWRARKNTYHNLRIRRWRKKCSRDKTAKL